MYELIRGMLFRLDAEKAHYLSMNLLKTVCAVEPLRKWLENCYTPVMPAGSIDFLEMKFRNPVGLGAGFDKNASYLRELKTLGFGFVEIGTVTPLPQQGNPKPRLFRLPSDKALINRMGFNNDGVEAIRRRLEQWQQDQRSAKENGTNLIIGGNIGKNKDTPNQDAWKDYEICFNRLFDVVDYFVVNVSSPNTPGLRALQDKNALKEILTRLQENNRQRPTRKPILLKIAPDLTDGQLQDIADLADEIKLDGIVTSNTTISRDMLSSPSLVESQKIGAGGLSGKPLKVQSDLVLKTIADLTGGKTPLIASGGIFTGTDAQQKIALGAQLVQVWTGFIYEGPGIVKKICNTLNSTTV
jgi:dihydroorotate dehydrogenase